MSSLRKAVLLRAIFEMGSFSALDVADRAGEGGHEYVQNLISEYARKGYLVPVTKIRLQRPGPPQKVWALEPSKQARLLDEIAPLYEMVKELQAPIELTDRRSTETREADVGSQPTKRSPELSPASDRSVITYHFVQGPTGGSTAPKCPSTTVEFRRTGNGFVVKDVLKDVYPSEIKKPASARIVMVDENKISSGAATLYSRLHQNSEPGMIVDLMTDCAVFTIAIGETVEFSRTRRFSDADVTLEVRALWKSLAVGATHSALGNWSKEPVKVLATVIEGLGADLSFFSVIHPNRSISVVLLSGIAPVYAVDLVRMISEKFKVHCEASDPLRVVRVDPITDAVLGVQSMSARVRARTAAARADLDKRLSSVYKAAPLIGYGIRNLVYREGSTHERELPVRRKLPD